MTMKVIGVTVTVIMVEIESDLVEIVKLVDISS